MAFLWLVIGFILGVGAAYWFFVSHEESKKVYKDGIQK